MCFLSKLRWQFVGALLLLWLLFSALPLSAQSLKSYLPVLGGTDAELGVALVNPTLVDAVVTLTARAYNGSLLQGTGIVNPVSVQLPASSQKALLASEIFGQAITGNSGWIELTPSSPAIRGFFLLFDSQLSFIDGTGLISSTSSWLLFPNASPSSILSFINTGTEQLSVSVALYDNSGHLFKQQQLSMGPLSGFSGTVDMLVPGIAGFDGYLVLDSGSNLFSQGSLVGIESFKDKSDIAVLQALQKSDQVQSGYIAHLATQGQYTSTLILVNPDPVQQTVLITAGDLRVGGQPRVPSSQAVQRIIPPYGRLVESVDSLFGFTTQPLITGYVHYEVTNGTGGMFGYLAYETTDGTVLAAVPAQGTAYSDLFFAQLAQGLGYYTGLAVVNPNTTPAIISFDTFDNSGTRTGSTVLTLNPGEHRARLFSELLANFGQVGGYAHFSSTRPVFTYELFGSAGSLTFLANVAAQGVPLQPQSSGTVVTSGHGAQVLSSDGLTSLIIPPLALPADTTVSVTSLATENLLEIAPSQLSTMPDLAQTSNVTQAPDLTQTSTLATISGNLVPIGNTQLQPAGLKLQTPLLVTFPVRAQLNPGTQLPVFLYNTSTNQYARTSFSATADESGRNVSAQVTQLATFVVGLPHNQILPAISVTPNIGAAGTTVNISGSGFSATASQNLVTFAGSNNLSVAATVTAATTTLLTVVVPAGTVSGSVMVRVGTQTCLGVPFTISISPNVTVPPPPPTVSAGPNQTITLPGTATLNGTASASGLPTGGILTTVWSIVSGPGTVTFGNVNALSTTANFSAAGSYVLRLTASYGGVSASSDVSIVVNPAVPVTPPPVPTFTYSPASPVTGSPESFDGSSSVCSALPCTYNWTDDANGSQLGTGVTMSITFQQTGTKRVRLTITDAKAQTGSVEHDVIVSAPPPPPPPPPLPPVAAFTYSPASPMTGSPASFDGSSSVCSALPCTYSWTDDTNGSQLGTGVTMSFTFQQTGTRKVRLTITDAKAQTGSVEHDLIVSAPPPPPPPPPAPPVAAFTYSPASPVTGSAVSFDGSTSVCSAVPCSYNWTDDTNGSQLGTGVTMSITFALAGTKRARLTITDAKAQTGSVEHDVIVSAPPPPPPPPPVAAFTYSPASPMTGSPVSFDGSSSVCSATPCSYSWTDDTNGSQLGTGVTTSMTFALAGTKRARLTITDAKAQTGSVEHDVIVSAPPPPPPPPPVVVSISPTSASVASQGTQQFTATVTGSTNTAVTWSATSGLVSSSGLFTAPTVGVNTTVTVTATSQADTGKFASATVTVNAPGLVFGYAVQGAALGTTMSNTVSATRYQMAGQNGTVTSMSVFIASPVSAAPNNQFQVAIYADQNGIPGALIASSGSQTIVPDAWNTVPISAPVAANAYYWLSYNTNGLDGNSNNLRYDAGGTPFTWISPEPFGTWPASYGPIGGSSNYNASMYATVNLSGPPVSSNGHVVDVTTLGAKGNGTNDDTVAIKNAIATLNSGDTLLFPCGTYLTTSQLFVNVTNVTVDGSSCATIHNTSSGTVVVIGGSGNGNPNYGPAVALSATANELNTSFTTVSSLGVSPGDYVYLHQGGKDSSNGSGDTACDPSGCRGEVLKVASVSGNTITVTTGVHDTYNPSVNAAVVQKILGPLTGITIRNIIFDGSGTNIYGFAMAGVAESTVSGVTSKNVQGAAFLNRGDFNVAWSNITVTGAGSAQCGDAVWFENQGNLSVSGMSISNENPGTGSGCLANGAFGFGLIASANGTISNLTVDAAGAFGRPFKATAARWNTFNSLTVKNGVQAYNGISLEYYSSHNAFNNCVVTNNGAGTGTGTGNAGINTFGNFNQYNTFSNCTVTGNGNVQLLINNYDALRLGQDIGNEIIGGTYTGSNTVEPVIAINGSNASVASATISGPGAQGLNLGSTNACVNNNTFGGGTGLGTGILSTSSTNIGSSNIMNAYSSNLTAGTCTVP